jgi:release factor glutamine methyltransferase
MPELAVPLRQIIDHSAERLRRAGIPEPRRHALRLWTEISGSSAADAVVRPESHVELEAAAKFHRAVERRASGEPLPHVTGWSGFRYLLLRSDARALIPRPETEGLVELLLQRVKTGSVVDVGTGGGCIALSLAREGAFSRIVAVDLAAEALELARLNRQLQGTGTKVELVRGDLCSALRAGAFDALISNPPYLTAREYGALDSSVRNWEPELALVSGADGLEATARLLEQGRTVLRPGGWLALEVDCSRAAQVLSRAVAMGWEDVTIHNDLFGRERYLLARRSETW